MPKELGPELPGVVEDGTTIKTLGPAQATLVLRKLGDKNYFQVEGTFSNEAFQQIFAGKSAATQEERQKLIRQAVERTLTQLKKVDALPLVTENNVGYFTFLLPYRADLLGAVAGLRFDYRPLLNPVSYDPDALKEIKALTPTAEGLTPKAGSTDSFSGLIRIGAPEFARKAESDIQALGAAAPVSVNGSSVRVGVTDTGITYNHPTFQKAGSKENRIDYMRDFTREGRVYFGSKAKFSASAVPGSEDELLVSAEVLVSPKLPALPNPDRPVAVDQVRIKVSPELKAKLLAPNAPARLGVLIEDSLQSPADPVDLNGNGKLDDQLMLIYVPGPTLAEDAVYFDSKGDLDFRAVKPLRSWNVAHETQAVLAERIGFDLRDDVLPDSEGKLTVPVKSASIVGYDPGNHGSHVSGIIAGSKTIANDSDQTLARGVAPAATILMNRVCANNGGCNATEAFIDLAVQGGAEVINMSLGGLSPFNDGYGVQETLINRLTVLKNVLFVISAGNSGPGRQTVGSPSVARLSLSVGASASRGLIQRQYQWPGGGALVDRESDQDFMLFFSSRGPTAAGGFKPNLSAPGTELSSVQLNTAPGSIGGLAVYWGTSMAAPTATGAYALLLDAVKKYNAVAGASPLPTNALTLRQVLISSARPADMTRFDPVTGEFTQGQYTWMDEGTGIIDLPAAWEKLLALRDSTLPSAVRLANGASVDLDYNVLVNLKAPNGIAYDGSRPGAPGTPALGSGLYIDYFGTDTLYSVSIARRVPESYSSHPEFGELIRQLRTTQDEFVLKTTFYGSNKAWLKAGTREELNCWDTETSNLLLLSDGAAVDVNPDGTGSLVPFGASNLNVCLNREMIANDLPPGDHGALIEAYRVVNGKTSLIPSFTVPVSITVPHKTLIGANAYELESSVRSFGVSRNYVAVPKGTNIVRVTLEVPAAKRSTTGALAPGESCSGVELMALQGGNTLKPPFKSRAEARLANCDGNGRPSDAKRVLSFSVNDPNPGLWDLHVFGSYKYAQSKFKIRVDYLTATSSIAEIAGDASALKGSLDWSVRDASLLVSPDAAKSSFELNALYTSSKALIRKGESVVPESAFGTLRQYPSGTLMVHATTGESAGNDIDLTVIECPAGSTAPDAPGCTPVAQSGGATDVEAVDFYPMPDRVYALRVDGYEVKGEASFQITEKALMAAQKGKVQISGKGPEFRISYEFSDDQLAQSKLLQNPLFLAGKVEVRGALRIRDTQGVDLTQVPVRIKQ